MTTTTAWTDVVSLVEQWINDDPDLSTLINAGATQQRPRSPYRGTFALLTWGGGGNARLSAETPNQRCLVAANINSVAYAPAVTAAVALCSALDTLERVQPVIGGWQLLLAEDVTGPLLLTRDSQGAELYVAATVHVQPAT